MARKVSVILLEDHLLVRQGVRTLVESSEEIEVVGEAGTAEEGLELLSKLSCDVVVLDLNLPGRNGLWCAARLRDLHPNLPVLILSLHTQRSVVMDAVRAGVRGFVAKSAHADELLAAVRTLAEGGSYFDARTAPTVLAMVRGEEVNQESGLSPREERILRLLCQGMSNQQIAELLSLSLSSIKNHLRELFSRYDVSNRAALVNACEAQFRQESLELPDR